MFITSKGMPLGDQGSICNSNILHSELLPGAESVKSHRHSLLGEYEIFHVVLTACSQAQKPVFYPGPMEADLPYPYPARCQRRCSGLVRLTLSLPKSHLSYPYDELSTLFSVNNRSATSTSTLIESGEMHTEEGRKIEDVEHNIVLPRSLHLFLCQSCLLLNNLSGKMPRVCWTVSFIGMPIV